MNLKTEAADPVAERIEHLQRYIADHMHLERQLIRVREALAEFDREHGRALDRMVRGVALTDVETRLVNTAGARRLVLVRQLAEAQRAHAPFLAAQLELVSRLAGRMVRT